MVSDRPDRLPAGGLTGSTPINRDGPAMFFRFYAGAAERLCLLAALAAVAVSAEPTRAIASELRRTATVKVVEQARLSVVNIHGRKTLAPGDEGYHKGDQPQQINGMGTGIVIDERGYIITNHHVVDGVKKIQVTLANEQSYVATMVSHDAKMDLAVIKINAPEKLPVINIGTSSDLMIGEPVIAVGNAFGYEHTVSRGVVSALHRSVQVSDAQSYHDLIQTDASINPGNSGGPLLNIDGEMVGIVVAVRAGAQGIGFAIPADLAMSTATNLMSIQRLESAYHGVIVQPDNPAGHELTIAEVESGSPADQAGLRAGDVVNNVGDYSIARGLDFERALLGHATTDEIPLVVRRQQKTVNLTLKLAQSTKADAPGPDDQAWDVIGLRFGPVSSKQFCAHQTRYRGGLLISAVRPDSPAAKQGIRRGDILVGMHVWETVSAENVAYVLSRPDFASIEPLKFYILRGNETLYGHLQVTLQRYAREAVHATQRRACKAATTTFQARPSHSLRACHPAANKRRRKIRCTLASRQRFGYRGLAAVAPAAIVA